MLYSLTICCYFCALSTSLPASKNKKAKQTKADHVAGKRRKSDIINILFSVPLSPLKVSEKKRARKKEKLWNIQIAIQHSFVLRLCILFTIFNFYFFLFHSLVWNLIRLSLITFECSFVLARSFASPFNIINALMLNRETLQKWTQRLIEFEALASS